MDSSVSETYGQQEGTAYNGHFECTCYHPLFLFNQFGDLERAMLRRGNNASAKFWRRVLLPVIERYRHLDIPKFFRGDAAFANPALYRLLEEEGYRYAIRLKANAVLEREIEHLLTRPVGRPSHKPKVFYHSFQYQAKSLAAVAPRGGQGRVARGRVVPAGRLHRDQPHLAARRTWCKFYNGRGTAEQWIKEGKNAVKWTKLSCRTFKDNQTRLQLFALAYNLGNFLRRLALPKPVRHWSLTTLREKLIKIGAKVTRHAKYVTFQLAEVAVTRNLFAAILDRIARLALPPPVVWPDACVERHGGAEKASDSRGQSAHCRCRSPEKHLVGHGSGRGNSETGAVGEKMEKNSLGARRGGGRVVTMMAISSLDRFQAQSIWEMSVQGISFIDGIKQTEAAA